MSTNEPFVSVVTPVYNTADYLREAIESVLAQSYGNFEYIIADNRSTDGSSEIAHEYERLDKRVRVVDHTEFLSQNGNYNRDDAPHLARREVLQDGPGGRLDLSGCAARDGRVDGTRPGDRNRRLVSARRRSCGLPRYSLSAGRASRTPSCPVREACRMYLLDKSIFRHAQLPDVPRRPGAQPAIASFAKTRFMRTPNFASKCSASYKFGFVAQHSELGEARQPVYSAPAASDFHLDFRHAYIIMVRVRPASSHRRRVRIPFGKSQKRALPLAGVQRGPPARQEVLGFPGRGLPHRR